VADEAFLKLRPTWWYEEEDKAPPEALDWAVRAWRALFYALTGTKEQSKRSFWEPPCQSFLSKYAKRYVMGTAHKYLKAHLAYNFAYGTSQTELPVLPDDSDRPGLLAGGWVYRTIKRAIAKARAGSTKATNLLYNLLMAKIGMPAVSDELVEKDVQSTYEALTHVHPDPEDGPLLREKVKTRIKSLIHHLFHGKKLKPRYLLPSYSAGCGCSSASGGQMAALAGRYISYMKTTCGVDVVPSISDMIAPALLVCMTARRDGGHLETRLPFTVMVNADLFRKYLLTRVSQELEGNVPNYVLPYGIKEPLKVRTITMGSASYYAVAMDLQRSVWEVLGEFPAFRWTTRPIDEEGFRNTFRPIHSDEIYVSADYVASTNNINPEMTDYTWKCISEEFTYLGEALIQTDYYQLGLQCLSKHLLLDPSINDTNRPCTLDLSASAEQKWGQLMGSPLSFPILNIINYCGTCTGIDLVACNELNPVRCNGDDAAFICRRDQYETWKRTMAAVGLERSIGKNYISPATPTSKGRPFIIMNSELRYAPYTEKVIQIDNDNNVLWDQAPDWEYRNYLNLGLLFGTVHKGPEAGQDQFVPWNRIGDVLTCFSRGFVGAERRSIRQLFMKFHHRELTAIPSLASYDVPLALGGAGLNRCLEDLIDSYDRNHRPIYRSPGRHQMVQAARLYIDHELRLNRRTPSSESWCLRDDYSLAARSFAQRSLIHQTERCGSNEPPGWVLSGYMMNRPWNTDGWSSLPVDSSLPTEKQALKNMLSLLPERTWIRTNVRLTSEYYRWVKGLSSIAHLHPLSLKRAVNFQEEYSWETSSFPAFEVLGLRHPSLEQDPLHTCFENGLISDLSTLDHDEGVSPLSGSTVESWTLKTIFCGLCQVSSFGTDAVYNHPVLGID